MKITLILIFIVSFSTGAFGSYPTIEGLFRNSSNKEITGTYIVLKFLVEESEEELFFSKVAKNELELLESVKEEKNESLEEDLVLQKKEKLSPKYLTWIISFKNENRTELLQVMYSDSLMKGKHIEYMSYINDLKKKIESEESLDKGLFYSLISTLVFNDSSGFSYFLKKQNIDFPSNDIVINQEKFKLLEKYKKYLQAKKEDETITETLNSPYEPENSAKKKIVNDLRKANMYKKSDYVKLSRIDGAFFWKVEMPRFKALFTNDKRELYKLEFSNDSSQIKVIVGNYLLFNGVHHLPKKVLFKDTFGKNFKIRMLDLKHYNNPKSIDIKKRREKYSKILKNKSNSLLQKQSEEFYNSLFFIK